MWRLGEDRTHRGRLLHGNLSAPRQPGCSTATWLLHGNLKPQGTHRRPSCHLVKERTQEHLVPGSQSSFPPTRPFSAGSVTRGLSDTRRG